MKRTAWNSTLPNPSKPLKRSGPIRKRGKSRFPKRRCAEYVEWLRANNRCAIVSDYCSAEEEVAHVRTRGAGGNDIGNTVMLCRRHHRAQHTLGITSFQRKYGVNLSALAQSLAARWRAEHPEAE